MGFRGLRVSGTTWAPKVCKLTAFMAVIMGWGPSFYILSEVSYGDGILGCRAYGSGLTVYGLGLGNFGNTEDPSGLNNCQCWDDRLIL